MTNESKTGFGYNQSGKAAKDEKAVELTAYQWVQLLEAAYIAVRNGAAPMLYTSADGNAICFSIRHGKSQQKYWIGPKDDSQAIINSIYREWNMDLAKTDMSPIDEVVAREVQKALVSPDGTK